MSPHPIPLLWPLYAARQARRDGGAYWLGYLQAMSDTSGQAPSALIAWMDRHDEAEFEEFMAEDFESAEDDEQDEWSF